MLNSYSSLFFYIIIGSNEEFHASQQSFNIYNMKDS